MPNTYLLTFTESQWEEIEALAEGIIPNVHTGLTRRQWMAIGYMALGKATQVVSGHHQFPGEDDADHIADSLTWLTALQGVAMQIFTCFKPGDNKL
jgi:hypothetical protein